MLLISTIFLLIVATNAQNCHDGDFHHDGLCYFYPNKKSNQADARQHCAQYGFTLPSLHSLEQETFLVEQMIKVNGKGYMWIGLEDVGGGHFEWDDFTQRNYSNWSPKGYPKYKYPCVMDYFNYFNSHDFHWFDDYKCTEKAEYFCQYYPPTTTSTTTTVVPTTTVTIPRSRCDSTDLLVTNRCYSFETIAQTYQDAQKYCQSIGKTLAIFENLSQINFVTSTAASRFGSTGNYWIGLYRNPSTNQFTWPDNSPMLISHWSSGYPLQGQSAVSSLLSTGKWVTSDVTKKFPVVCSGVF